MEILFRAILGELSVDGAPVERQRKPVQQGLSGWRQGTEHRCTRVEMDVKGDSNCYKKLKGPFLVPIPYYACEIIH